MYRAELVEAAAEYDDELLEKFLAERGDLGTRDQGRAAQGVHRHRGHAGGLRRLFKNKGVQPLLDAVLDYLPSPLDVAAIKGHDIKTGEEIERPPDPKAPFAALAFKVMTDPYVGKLTYFRVYSGKMDAGSYVSTRPRATRSASAAARDARQQPRGDRPAVSAGDIVAAVGLKNTTTGDTLCAENAPVLLESMVFPDPVIDIAIEPKTKAEQEKLGASLSKLAEEDPTFRCAPTRDRPDDHRRHGRAAPRGHRRPPAARVQGRGPSASPRSPTARPPASRSTT
jgi:elongation factor G